MYTVQLYRLRYAVSQRKQTTHIHTMHLQYRYLKIGTPAAHDGPQCSTSDAPKAQHHRNHSPVSTVCCTLYTVVYCTVQSTSHTLHSILAYSTIQVHYTPYTVYHAQAAHTVPAIFMDVKIMRIKAQEKNSNSSGIEFFLHKWEETGNFRILNFFGYVGEKNLVSTMVLSFCTLRCS